MVDVLVMGSGGREHALAWKIAQSSLVKHLYIAPGNPGTSLCGTNVPIDAMDFEGIANFIVENSINLLVVGPEAPLAAGITDFLQSDPRLPHLKIMGPNKLGALLESSKDFAKKFMIRHHIPTARYKAFRSDDWEEALQFLKSIDPPYVLKADGLAAGKGVVICSTITDATAELEKMLLEKKFGEASQKVLIEEFLDGIELSVFAITDGKHYCMLPEAKDYKRIGEGNTGPNTGGMGAVSPVPFATGDFMQKVEERIVGPTIRGLNEENIPYLGFIFFGLMNVKGEPYVIEYNVRLGDPEAEVVLPRLNSDLVELMMAAVDHRLSDFHLDVEPKNAVVVMLVSGGYPGKYKSHLLIEGLEDISDALVFHAGTMIEKGKYYTASGRVLAITTMGNSLEEAFRNTYRQVNKIFFLDMYFRKDLGKDLLNL